MPGKYKFAVLSIFLVVAVWNYSQTGKKTRSDEKAASAAPARDVKVTYGPLIQAVSETTAAITWSTSASTDTLIHYGTSADHLDQVARTPIGGTDHRVELKNLLPDTSYYYRVGTSAAQATEPMNRTATFKTKPATK